MPAESLQVRLRQSAPIPLDATLACEPGEVLALVGPSGSGKSTILRVIAGLLGVADGMVSCGGKVWLDTRERIAIRTGERRIGMVFQNYALFPHLSALANVMEAMSELPRAERSARAHAWLQRVHLAGLEDRVPARLSGGQQQRVAVARALAREPAVLLLDEPFSAVDHSTRRRLYQELAELRRELKMPVVLVTHDLDEAAMLADRMTVLSRGVTLQSGDPQSVMTRPDTVQVAQLVGLRNIFRAGVLGHDHERGVTFIEWRGLRLEARLQPQFAPGSQITWVIPQGSLILHRRDRPSRGERENPVGGTVSECIRMGDSLVVAIRVRGTERPPLHLSIPMHVASRNGIAQGAEIGVSLLADAIHLMAPDERHRAARESRDSR